VTDTAPRSGRFVGLDIGSVRIGVALSDELGIIASPETTIIVRPGAGGEQGAITAIVQLVRDAGAIRVVAGLPRNMKGERGVQAQWTDQFVAVLGDALRPYNVYVSMYDERFSSVSAARVDEGRSRNARGSRGKERDGASRYSVDARAAALILQGYLDRRRQREERRLDDQTRDS
jgi:putative Holliday junction resolvase